MNTVVGETSKPTLIASAESVAFGFKRTFAAQCTDVAYGPEFSFHPISHNACCSGFWSGNRPAALPRLQTDALAKSTGPPIMEQSRNKS